MYTYSPSSGSSAPVRSRRTLTLVIVPTGPTREAARVLAERFPYVRQETGSVLVPVSRRETAESILAYCAEKGVSVAASCVVGRTVVTP